MNTVGSFYCQCEPGYRLQGGVCVGKTYTDGNWIHIGNDEWQFNCNKSPIKTILGRERSHGRKKGEECQ